MRKLILFRIALTLSLITACLIGCGEDEEPEKPAGSGISHVYPESGASDVSTTTSVLIIFKNDILTPSMANLSFTPGVSGTVSYDPDTLTLVFKPSSPLSGNTQYTMNIDGIIDVSGNPTSAVTSKFTTSGPDTKRPEITFSYPADGQKDIGHAPDIFIKFNEPIFRSKMESRISLQPTIEPSLDEWHFEWGLGSEVELTIYPPAGADPLDINKEYSLIIPKSGFEDLSGNTPSSDQILTFHTLKYPVERIGNLVFGNAMVVEAWLYRVGKVGRKWAIFFGGQRPAGGPSVSNPSGTITASADGQIDEGSVDYWEAEGRAHTITVTKGDGNRLSFTNTADQADDYYRIMFTTSSRYLTFQLSGVSKEWIHIGNDQVNPSRTPFIMED